MLPGHAVLVRAAIRWLRSTRKCPVVFSEHVTRLNLTPDAIGWYWDWSILVECKASRSDFFADRQKPIHGDPDGYPGQERWYLTPPGMVKVEELPQGWRLAELHGWDWEAKKPGRVRVVSSIPRWDEQVFNDRRSRAELPLLLSAVRRHQDPEIRWLDDEAKFESINRRRARESAARPHAEHRARERAPTVEDVERIVDGAVGVDVLEEPEERRMPWAVVDELPPPAGAPADHTQGDSPYDAHFSAVTRQFAHKDHGPITPPTDRSRTS